MRLSKTFPELFARRRVQGLARPTEANMIETARTRKNSPGRAPKMESARPRKKLERHGDDMGEPKKKNPGWQVEHMGKGQEKNFAGGLSPESGQIRSNPATGNGGGRRGKDFSGRGQKRPFPDTRGPKFLRKPPKGDKRRHEGDSLRTDGAFGRLYHKRLVRWAKSSEQ